LCLYLDVYYLQTHQNYYLDLLQALVACEVLVMSFYLGLKLRKTKLNVTSLKAEEERLKLFTQIMEEAILIRDGETVVEVNDVSARMLGYEISEMIGRNIYQFMAPQSAEENKLWIKKGYPSDNFELTAKRKDGTTFPILVHGRNITYKGRPMRLSCGWDITELKNMQEAVQKSEDRFKQFAEVTREGIMIHEKGVIVDVNQALADMVGKSLSDFIGADSLFFVDEKSADLIRKYRSGALPALPSEITLRHSNGKLIRAETYATDILWHGRKARVVRIWDFTERKKIEKALLESEERFKRFAEVTKEGIFVHDNGVIVDANQALADMLGYTVEYMIGKNNSEFLDKESNERALSFREVGYPVEPYEVTLRRKNGTFIPVEVHGAGFSFNGKDLRVARLWNLTDRKKMDEALLESQERFKRFAAVAKEGIEIHNNGIIVDANQALADMLGFTVEEMIGKDIRNFSDEKTNEFAFKFRKEGYPDTPYEITLRRKDGTFIPVEVHSAGFSEDGKKMRVASLWDITARKKMEEALKQSEQSFRNLIEKFPDGVMIRSLEGQKNLVYVNESILQFLGYAEEELMAKQANEIIHPSSFRDVENRRTRLLSKSAYNPAEEKMFIRRDGTTAYGEVVSFLVHFEGKPMAVIVVRDLTERKKSEEALKKSEQNFRNLIERSPDGVLIHTLDENPKIVYINGAMMKLVGYQADELIGQKADYFVHSRHVPGVRERIAKMKSKEEYNPPQEKLLIRKDGELVYAEVVSFLIHYEGVTMAAVWARDLTERKKSEEALMKLERLSTIGEMAAGMAHEIRNPLAAISSAAQILKRKKIKEDNGQLETILGQSDRLEKLVRDTLDYAKTGAGLPHESFTMKPVLENALNLSQIQFGPLSKSVNILWDVSPEDIPLKGDSGRIQQILVNLILNAFQIMVSEGVIILSLHRDKDFVLVRVADNGPGISDANMKRIFEPFFTTKNHGSGLGLALSQRIAQEHGGQIKVERLAPRGTAFILQLPLNGESKS